MPVKRPPLTPKQVEARDAFFHQHVPIVYHVVGRLRGHEAVRRLGGRHDASQVGMIALLHACSHFDGARGVKFFSYAMKCVRNAIVQKGLACKVLRQVDEEVTPFRAVCEEKGHDWRTDLLLRSLRKLNAADRRLLELRFGFGGRTAMGNTELGNLYGRTRDAMNQRVQAALRRLRKKMEENV